MSDLVLGIAPPGDAQADLGDPDAPFTPELDDLELDAGGGGELSVDTVRGVLEVVGLTLHSMLGDEGAGDEHWRFTSEELDLLAPAVLRIALRRPKLRQAIEHGDEMTVALLLAGYFGRNIEATRVARKDADGDVDRQAEGTAAAAGPAGGGAQDVDAWLGHGWQGDGGGSHDDAAGHRGEGR